MHKHTPIKSPAIQACQCALGQLDVRSEKEANCSEHWGTGGPLEVGNTETAWGTVESVDQSGKLASANSCDQQPPSQAQLLFNFQ